MYRTLVPSAASVATEKYSIEYAYSKIIYHNNHKHEKRSITLRNNIMWCQLQ